MNSIVVRPTFEGMTLRERITVDLLWLAEQGISPGPPDETAGYSEEEWAVYAYALSELLKHDGT